MADDLGGRDDVESQRMELLTTGRAGFRSNSAGLSNENDEENALLWAAIQRLPTVKRLRSSVFDENDHGDETTDAKRKRVIEVTKLGDLERHVFIEKLIKNIQLDNLSLLQKIRKRIDKVGIELQKVEVRYNNLSVEAECEVVPEKPLPTLWNSVKGMCLGLYRLSGLNSRVSKIRIIDGVSGTISPGRITLLLGPPGSGKTSLLKALSGNLDKSLKVTGEISYNGFNLKEFVPQKTSAYIGQHDLHIPEMTVRETLDFSSQCQGVGSRIDIMTELSRREKEAGIIPDLDIDTYMKAISVEGQKKTLQTDYILKILGLDICADTMVGDTMRRGISGGQKKRLTTGEMIVGPLKTFFIDDMSNGLDNSTTYQIAVCLQQLAHISHATVIVSLLQPPPETFDLFDDIILMAEGKIVYHGPRSNVLEFIERCGFRCPERKGIADFLLEVISRKDQVQYWKGSRNNYRNHSVTMLSKKFKESAYGIKLGEHFSEPVVISRSHKDAIAFEVSIPSWRLFKTCMSREFLLLKRNSFAYMFKSVQLLIVATVTMTVFLRTRMHIDLLHASLYWGALSYTIIFLFLDGRIEIPLTIARLPIFYKQRDSYFYPAWAYAIPSAILKIPLSLLVATVWTCLTYYVIGYSPGLGRFSRHLVLLFALHLTALSMYRFLASVLRTRVAAATSASLLVLVFFIFSGFVIPRSSMPNWLKWGFWLSPLSYAEIGLAVNEFLSPRWQEMLPTSTTVGQRTLETRGLNFNGYFYWISLGALFGFVMVFNIGFMLALTFLQSSSSRAIISSEKFFEIQKRDESDHTTSAEEVSQPSCPSSILENLEGKIVLPFEPLTLVFKDLQYYVETPPEYGFAQKRLQLLRDITAALRPGVLTALMGVSGAGKTTLLDVLAGRKTIGTIEGEIKIGGFPKVQKTFARVSGYCEQNDIHSPHITVEESVIFSAWLRLDPEIDSKTKYDFVQQVLETIELHKTKDALVGISGVSGLSNNERKRLTIAVELVANPSIIFLDEPTTGLDARAATIVMRAVRNVANAGRTIVCTIHQPSIDVFETFDELILLKSGGRMIYSGPLGKHSCKVIEYFEGISGVPKMINNYNPATWMLEVSSTSAEIELGIDFAEIYKHSSLYRYNKELVKQMSSPLLGSKDLEFTSPFSQNYWGQFKACLWKQYWSYWRSPSYNLTRFLFTLIASIVFGTLFWDQATKIKNQQSLFTILGSMFSGVLFCGVNSSTSVMPYVSNERPVFYRERFAGMYTSWAYPVAQVIVEIPFVFAQTLMFTVITYPMIGYYGSTYKIFWYIYSTFCTWLYFKYLGMMLIAITPSFQVATILEVAFYTTFNLFGGFMIPKQHIPEWWIWLYYISPTSWSLNGLLTSQYGDINMEIEVFGETKTVAAFLRDYFGYQHNKLPLVAVILIFYPILFASIFALCLGKLNFQRR